MAYPSIDKPGVGILRAKPHEWRELFNDVRKAINIRVEGYERKETATDVRFVPYRVGPDVVRYNDKYVVIVDTPESTDRTLRVREVSYKFPAEPCSGDGDSMTCHYRWQEEPFDAFPLFGLKATDYESEVTDGITAQTVTPPADSTILRCFRNHDAWIVDKVSPGGGTSIKPAIVLAVGAATITAQPMKRSGTGWVIDGPLLTDVPLWGDQQGVDFQIAISSLVGNTRWFIPLIQLNGEWHAMQYIWFGTGTPGATQRGDCV